MSSLQVTDPLYEKHKTEGERLNRRRKAASETSKEIVVRREAFFDRLALLNTGALTFSVTLLGSLAAKNPHGKYLLFAAWLLLLLAVGACLMRNLSHQHYQLADAMTEMAESEIAYIDAAHALMTERNIAAYSDSTEPYDKPKEIALNRSNRDVWSKSLDEQQRKSTWHWRIVHGSEWTAGIAMILGLALLVIFAIRNM